MNKIIYIVLFVSLLLIGVSCQNDSESDSQGTTKNHNHYESKIYYTCSMHPQIKEEKPGKCPICHMNLTKIEIDEGESVQTQANIPSNDIWQCEKFPDVTSETEGPCPIDGTQMVKKRNKKMAAKVVAKVKLRKAQLKHFEPAFFPVTSMKMIKKIRLLGSVLQSEEKESN